jgi:peptidoglycan hydrolase CwlO-like protein
VTQEQKEIQNEQTKIQEYEKVIMQLKANLEKRNQNLVQYQLLFRGC